jgi:hypothetical protein
MRWHRHWLRNHPRRHSVRVRHTQAWDWCAHQEELEAYRERPERATRRLSLQRS